MVKEKLKAGPTTQRKTSGRNIVNSLLMKITKNFQGEGSWPETFANKNLIKDGFQEKTNRMKAWNQRMWTDQFHKNTICRRMNSVAWMLAEKR